MCSAAKIPVVGRIKLQKVDLEKERALWKFNAEITLSNKLRLKLS
jgi:hypothetical protein